jgi:arylsulfatase A-like enzyme/Tfp pilus assembly protein PilF
MQRTILIGLAIVLTAGCTRERPRDNVLLITLDTLRADHVGAYGSRNAKTPAIDSLAARGVRFEHAMSAVPLTLPSHATILSGLLPPHHGLRNNGAGVFPADRQTLATLFSANGYRTAAFIAAFVLDRRFGLQRGFDVYDDEIPRDPALGDRLEAERRGDEVARRAIEWLGRNDERPFFAWVHLYDAHFPYAGGYDAEVAFVDAQVKALLDEVDRLGQRDRTIVIVAGDHGEALGEHGELTHGLLLYEPSLRVPFIVAAPGLLDPRVVTTPVGLADLAPTLAGLTGLALRGDGRDLADALRRGEEPPQADLYAETEYPALYGWSPLAAMRRGKHKYIASPDPELFDLAADPHETRNILRDERRVMRALDAQVKALRATAAPVPAGAPDAETMARLASLGYVGGAVPARTGADRPDPKRMVSLFRRFEEATWATTDRRLDEAAATLEDLVRSDPANPVFRASLARVERQRGGMKRAVELYREAVAYAPGDARAWYDLASAFGDAGDMKHAAEAAREALKRDAKSADAHNVLGIVDLSEGNPGGAMEEFRRAIAIDPRNPRAYNNIGNVARALRRSAEAEEAYRKALELAPAYADPLNGLGALEIDRDRHREALAYFDRALQLDPRHLEARLNRAVALQLSGDLRGAAEEYRTFLEQSSDVPAFAAQREGARAMLRRLQARRD